MLKHLLTRFALWFLSPPDLATLQPKGYDGDKVKKWLAESFVRDEFRWYFAKKDYALMKQMASGLEGKEYWKAYGRRQELLELLSAMRVEHERAEKKKAER